MRATAAETSFGEHVGEAVQAVADYVQSVVIPGVGHFVAEESPDELLAALTALLAPFRDGQAAAQDPRPHAAAASGGEFPYFGTLPLRRGPAAGDATSIVGPPGRTVRAQGAPMQRTSA
jgi:hypothetical protein